MEAASRTHEKLHIIVPCRGRLEFIKQTISPALAQPNTNYIFVDYSCPQNSGAWVAANYPLATVVTIPGRDYWHASEARNAGAKAADGGWLCFVDGDIILNPEFSETILELVESGTYLAAPKKSGIYGLTICAKEDFDRIGGYDEILRLYRGEDVEIRVSLDRIGLKSVEISDSLVTHIDHDDEIRVNDPNIKEQMATDNINMLYIYIKDYLIRNGEPHDEAVLREVLRFCQERFFAGFPWLSWPDPDQPFITPDSALEFADNKYGSYTYVFRTLASVARGYLSITAAPFGCVRAFRIARSGKPAILELLTIYKSHSVIIESPGRSHAAVMSLAGVVTEVPLENGRATIALSCQPVFLLDGAELVRELAVTAGPCPGNSVAVDLVPASDYTETVELAAAVGGNIPERRAVHLEGAPIRKIMGVAVEAVDRPEDVTITVTGSGFVHEIVRRTTFVTAVKVSDQEAERVSPPERAGLFVVGGQESWRDIIPNSYRGLDDLRADVAWGWTDTALVCWITRYDDVPLEGSLDCDGIQLAVDPLNHRALFASGYEFKLCWKDARSWIDFQKFVFGENKILPELLTREESGSCNRMVARLPFSLLGISPRAGRSIGVSMLFRDNDGEGLKGRLEWGGGIWYGRNPRAYNEITLTI